MATGAQDIVIERLRISGDARSSRTFVGEMEHANWPLPLPGNLHNAWILVRELRVSGAGHQLHRQTAQQLDNLLNHAVEGRHAHNNASAIRFNSLAELLAFLMRDLALGQAAGKWYWQRWHYLLRPGREHAVAELICEHSEELPAIVEHLAEIGQLRLVWQTLSSATAQKLVQFVATRYGISLASPAAVENAFVDSQIYLSALRQFSQQHVLLNRWISVLPDERNGDQRWVLAALVSGIKHCPLLMMRNPLAVITAFIQQCEQSRQPTSAITSPDVITAAKKRRFLSPTTSVDSDLAKASLTPVLEQDTAATSSQIVTHTVEILDSTEVIAASETREASITRAVKPALLDELNSQEVPVSRTSASSSIIHAGNLSSQDTYPDTSVDLFINANMITCYGGFFYLVNALRFCITPTFLADQLSPSGWLWVFDCARLLAQKVGLDLDQSLLRFVMGLTDEEDLAVFCEREPSPIVQTLFAALEQRFGAQDFWSATNNLLACTAQVVSNASHIDVYYPLNAVRLDIRLAGLDVNPGWVPWLGRVINFHYIEAPGLWTDGGENAH